MPAASVRQSSYRPRVPLERQAVRLNGLKGVTAREIGCGILMFGRRRTGARFGDKPELAAPRRAERLSHACSIEKIRQEATCHVSGDGRSVHWNGQIYASAP